MHFGQHDAADEERHELNAGLHRIGLEHIALGRPIRVGEPDLLGAKARMHPGPDRAQVAVDDQLTPSGVANGAGDRAF